LLVAACPDLVRCRVNREACRRDQGL